MRPTLWPSGAARRCGSAGSPSHRLDDVVAKRGLDDLEPVRHAMLDGEHVPSRNDLFAAAAYRAAAYFSRCGFLRIKKLAAGYNRRAALEHVENVGIRAVNFSLARPVTAACVNPKCRLTDQRVAGFAFEEGLCNHPRVDVVDRGLRAGVCERLCTGNGHFLVLLRAGGSADADAADNVIALRDRDTADERGKPSHRGGGNHGAAPFVDRFLQGPGRALKHYGGACLANRNIRTRWKGPIEPLDENGVAAHVDHRNGSTGK